MMVCVQDLLDAVTYIVIIEWHSKTLSLVFYLNF